MDLKNLEGFKIEIIDSGILIEKITENPEYFYETCKTILSLFGLDLTKYVKEYKDWKTPLREYKNEKIKYIENKEILDEVVEIKKYLINIFKENEFSFLLSYDKNLKKAVLIIKEFEKTVYKDTDSVHNKYSKEHINLIEEMANIIICIENLISALDIKSNDIEKL